MFTMSKEDKFNFDIDNIKQDFAIENINIQEDDLTVLKMYSNDQISMNEMIDIFKKGI